MFITVVAGVLVSAQSRPADPYRSVAERYVKLVLAVGQHDADYVDAFYGPAEWRKEAETAKPTLAAIDAQAATVESELKGLVVRPDPKDTDMWVLRRQYLSRQLASLRSRVAMLQGKKFTFDEESLALYDAVAPVKPAAEFEAVLTQLAARLPGEGPLIDRYDRFKQAFIIPKNRLDRVFQEAIRACRSRMPGIVNLPTQERFTVEYVTGKSWSGYNWYQGNLRSVIQVNTDLPIYVDRAIDLACHEGYPGHHVYNALLEKHLVMDRGWIEYTVYPLFSPQSLIAEGTANYGIEVAFSTADRLTFERDVLFPLAGLNPQRVVEYYGVLELVERLSYAGNEAARQYINGTLDREGAIAWLEKYGLYTRPRAEQRLKFIEQYRSYVINYNLGKDLVRAYVERRMGRDKTPARRWREFTALLSSPRLPSGLK
ncbi:MAG TPA: hypothetical protein VEA16_12175 [Vicinamibacterales bacterium]|nr:hypothetical protein [Vicinamibacterales bacterium]